MTLREKIIYIIDCVEDQDDNVCMGQAADAILAAIREHMTSPEAVERGLDAAHKLPNVYGASGKIRAAILAALGGEL